VTDDELDGANAQVAHAIEQDNARLGHDRRFGTIPVTDDIG
jgi:hypothetical protein